MIILIDNYDSFSYNLYQLVGELQPDIKVIRNDEYTVQEIEQMNPSHLIISPGPGRPDQAGICEEAVQYFKGKLPVLGVCLGHQAICEAFGATVSYAKKLMHGKMSIAEIDNTCPVFAGLGKTTQVARYHSLAAVKETLPQELVVTAQTEDGEVMAVKHKDYDIYGLQFHPESILTPEGKTILQNFVALGNN
jgi:anthranilate synthase component 2